MPLPEKLELANCLTGENGVRRFMEAYHSMPADEFVDVGIGSDGHGTPFVLVGIPAGTLALSPHETRLTIELCRRIETENPDCRVFSSLAGALSHTLGQVLAHASGVVGHA